MADWRQIQARIRKAKNSSDAPAKLSDLYQRTRDAMVAWELGAIEEKAEHKDEAVNWYTIAAQRFRRADWKKKAEEALTRLGVALPPAQPETKMKEHAGAGAEEAAEAFHSAAPEFEESHEVRLPLALGEIALTAEAPSGAPLQPAGTTEGGEGIKRKRRRGRRGGRGRRRKGASAAPGLPAQAFAEPAEHVLPRPPAPRPSFERGAFERPPAEPAPFVPERPARVEPPLPQLPSERTAHGRAGDPALASRMAYLESMLRRLVGGTLHRLDEADEAPAGPGVFLLSDSDQITLYYVEACQTLRIGLANLVRGGRGGKSRQSGRGFADRSDLKAKLAEHLEISEAKVSQYLKDHCVVRWIQLDEDAPLLAHFAIGVLRTPLNLD
jgi:hypothetical protein